MQGSSSSIAGSSSCLRSKKALLHFVWARRDGRKRPGPPTTSESVGHCGRLDPPAGRARFLVAQAPCRARFRRFPYIPAQRGLGRFPYTAQRALRRFPYTTRHGGDCQTLYTGDPVRTGVCTPVAACTVQTPVGTGLLVRKVPIASSGHRASPQDVPRGAHPHKVQKPQKKRLKGHPLSLTSNWRRTIYQRSGVPQKKRATVPGPV